MGVQMIGGMAGLTEKWVRWRELDLRFAILNF